MRKIVIFTIAGIITLGLGYAIYRSVTISIPLVEVVEVKRGEIASTVSSSTVAIVQPIQQVKLSFATSGRIRDILVEEGDVVSKGQSIATLDDEEQKARIEEARAEVKAAEIALRQAKLQAQLQDRHIADEIEQAKLKLEEAKVGLWQAKISLEFQKLQTQQQIGESEAEISVAAARLVATENPRRSEEIEEAKQALAVSFAEWQSAKQNLERMQNLFEKEVVSKQKFDEASTECKIAEAQYLRSQYLLDLVQAGAKPEDVQVAKAQLKHAQAALDLTKSNSSLTDIKAQEVAIAQIKVDEAKKALDVAKERLSLQNQISTEQIESLQAKRDKAKASLRLAEVDLQNTILKSPLSGIVSKKHVEVGETVDVRRGSLVVAVVDISRVWVEAGIDETDIGKVKVGQLANVKFDAYPDKVFDGKVTEIAAVVDEEEHEMQIYKVKVQLDNPTGMFKPGMSADVQIVVDKKENALIIPQEALLRIEPGERGEIPQIGKDGLSYIFCYENSKARIREVKTGISDVNFIEIVAGLSEWEKVLIYPPDNLKDCDEVRVKEVNLKR